MTNTELTTIFESIQKEYFSRNTQTISAEFYPYRSLRHTIEWNRKTITIKVGQYFNNAPDHIIEILAIILLAKIYKNKVDLKIRKIYNQYAHKLQEDIPKKRRKIPIEYESDGMYFNLRFLFDKINKTYFENNLAVKYLGWSKNKSYTRLGYYDQERNLLVISKIFDSRKVPQNVVEFLLYHEMLHIMLPSQKINGRRKIHTNEFRELEQRFPDFKQIEKWIKHKRHKL